MAKRAERRAHVARLKKARQRYWGREDLDCSAVGMVVTTPAICSCWMCGNPRKYFGERTVQERRQMQEAE